MSLAEEKPRWQYRFDNFSRAFLLLREAIEIKAERSLSQLEKEGIIQRFEYTMELAWKTLKDYLESQSVVFEQVTPKSVIKKAIQSNILGNNGQVWLNALDARNKMSHTYNFNEFELVIEGIEKEYLAGLEAFYLFLLEQVAARA